MIEFNIKFEKVNITHVEEADILKIADLLSNHNVKYTKNHLQIENIYYKFLEYYLVEDEFFNKVVIEDKIIGVIKGRIERDAYNRAVISLFALRDEYKNKLLEGVIMNNFLKYLQERFEIEKVSITLNNKDLHYLKLFEGLGFQLKRVTRDFYEVDTEKYHLLIMEN